MWFRGQEFLAFFSKTIAERTERGMRQTVEEESTFISIIYTTYHMIDNVAHAFMGVDGLACIIICDTEYPARVAFALINRVLEEFHAEFPRDRWITASQKLDFPKLKEMLTKYQDPHEADPIMKVQRELDETKVILVHRIL